MNECSAYVGPDVHKDTIAVAVAGRTGRGYRAINQSTLVPLRTVARESSGCGDLRARPVSAGRHRFQRCSVSAKPARNQPIEP